MAMPNQSCFIFLIATSLVGIIFYGFVVHLKYRHIYSFLHTSGLRKDGLPFIYIITPTYKRLTQVNLSERKHEAVVRTSSPFLCFAYYSDEEILELQKADLTSVAAVLKSVPNIRWIVVEDSIAKSRLLSNLLESSGLEYTHLIRYVPKNAKQRSSGRGASQRNAGLLWLRRNLNPDVDKGVVYFADDDNTYTAEVFEEIRYTKVVSVFPVGLVGGLKYEAPLVKNGKVVGWHTAYLRHKRRFALDMAGFAVNVKVILKNKNASFSYTSPPGHLETCFLESLNITLDDLEPKAKMGKEVLVWHTKTRIPSLQGETTLMRSKYEQSDPNVEV